MSLQKNINQYWQQVIILFYGNYKNKYPQRAHH